MSSLSKYRVLIAGIISSPAAAYLGLYFYRALTSTSADPNQDFVFRLSVVALVMTAPFLLTLVLAILDRRRGGLSISGKVGMAMAVLSLGLVWLPLRGLVGRVEQARNAESQDVPAPLFDTTDLAGKSHRLQDYYGKVVLINAWATWCPPCREEMPQLDRLFQTRKEEGFIVLGLSTEDVELQRKFVQERIPVSYPLLTLDGNVPSLYRDIQRWPAFILIDRKGRLQPAPQAGAHFEKVEEAVNALLKGE